MYKILSLDGGGSWSIIQVMCLQNIYGEDAKGFDILKRFHLVVANSGGSLVLAAMCMNLPLSEIYSLLDCESKRKQVFSILPLHRRIMNKFGLGPKYDASQKHIGLRALLGPGVETVVEDVPHLIWPDGSKKTHILICGFDYDKQRVQFFRSNIESEADSEVKAGKVVNQIGSYKLLDAIHSASNAPVRYFDRPALVRIGGTGGMDERYWDGAVAGFNNPIMAGVTEALANGNKVKDLQVFSIGTGNNLRPLARHFPGEKSEKKDFFVQPEKPRLLSEIKKMATSILSDPPDSASFMAHTLIRSERVNEPFPVLRLNPLVSPLHTGDDWTLWPGFDSLDTFNALIKLDMDAVAQSEVDLIKKLCTAWMDDQVMNQPISHDKCLKVVVDNKSGFPMGFDLFSTAKREWITRDTVPI